MTVFSYFLIPTVIYGSSQESSISKIHSRSSVNHELSMEGEQGEHRLRPAPTRYLSLGQHAGFIPYTKSSSQSPAVKGASLEADAQVTNHSLTSEEKR